MLFAKQRGLIIYSHGFFSARASWIFVGDDIFKPCFR